MTTIKEGNQGEKEIIEQSRIDALFKMFLEIFQQIKVVGLPDMQIPTAYEQQHTRDFLVYGLQVIKNGYPSEIVDIFLNARRNMICRKINITESDIVEIRLAERLIHTLNEYNMEMFYHYSGFLCSQALIREIRQKLGITEEIDVPNKKNSISGVIKTTYRF